MNFYPHLIQPRPEALPGQFILARCEMPIPPGWKNASHGPWILFCAPDLPFVQILKGSGEFIGWVLGHVITPEGVLAQSPLRLETDTTEGENNFEKFVDSLGGRFLVILFTGSTPRVYPDPFAMLAAVYAPDAEILASTSSLIPLSSNTPFQLQWITALDIPYQNNMYPLGLTPRLGIERLLPNHFLDMGTWIQKRRWPLGPLPTVRDISAAQKRIAELAKRAISAVANVYPIQSPLTAGRDSRVLLACARDVLDRMSFFTAHIPNEPGWRDVVMAREIATRFRLRHSILPSRRASRKFLREWMERTGGETGEYRGWKSIRTFRQLDPNKAVLIGWAGDIARPIWWKKTPVNAPMTPKRILEICGGLYLPEFVDRAEKWLERLPVYTGINAIDLFLSEQRGGCWAGVLQYAEDGDCPARLAPLNHAEIIRTMMCLPEEYRRSMSLESDIIGSNWPELLEHPFNDDVAISQSKKVYYRAKRSFFDRVTKFQRVVRRTRIDPSWLVGKIADRLS